MIGREEREAAFRAEAVLQRGAVPYENERVLTVKGHQDGMSLSDFLSRLSGWGDADAQQKGIAEGRLRVDGKVPDVRQSLRAGNRVWLVFPPVSEPPVSPALEVLHEDEDILVVKPAPLPVHPSGRYNRHSLTEIAKRAWPDLTLKPVHRLDCNTGGLLLFGKHRDAAQALVEAFASHTVEKTYVARVTGDLPESPFSVNVPIGRFPGAKGLREVTDDGLPALTDFQRLETLQDGTSLVECHPRTGRTNQIRIHLAHAGHPIVGDAPYGGWRADGASFSSDEEPLFLFASRLAFQHPRQDVRLTFEAQVPIWFRGTTVHARIV